MNDLRAEKIEIFKNVYQMIVGESEFKGVYPPNVFLIQGDEGSVLIDTAYGESEEIKYYTETFEALNGSDMKGIILTHRHGDHIGGAKYLSRETRAPIWCHIDEKDAIENELVDVSVDKTLNDEDTLDLGGVTLRFIHIPGHTMGSLGIIHTEAGILFSGDMILGTGTTVISPHQGDMSSYIQSMRRLLTVNGLEFIAPGHGPVIKSPYEKFQELIDHRIDREAQIISLLEGADRIIDDLLEAIYVGDIHPNLYDTAKSQILSHLIKLEYDGRVVEGENGIYRLANDGCK